ncbi:MAG: hypothetical protein HEP71_08070 [Roseivirga sp.]|nr:hypothetical protein [Roseivirga sp.]
MKKNLESGSLLSTKFMSLLFMILIISLWGCSNSAQTETMDTGTAPVIKQSELINLIGNDFLIDDQHSYIGFKIKYFGFSPVRGRFDSFDGTVFYNPEIPESLSVSLIINVQSINTGVEMRDDDLQTEGPGWFNVRDFPQIHFSSNKVTVNKDSTFTLSGDLTINGITKTISADFSTPTPMTKDLWANDQVDFSGTLIINRMDFEVEGGDFWSKVMENGVTQLSHDVEIELDIHTRRTDYLARMASEDSTNIRVSIPALADAESIVAAIEELKRLRKLPNGPLSAGALSTIGYTFFARQQLKEARSIFLLRQEFYPDRLSTYNQLGIIALAEGDTTNARNLFLEASKDSTDSRPMEYLKLIEKITQFAGKI